jgi:hypothetical protein
MLRRRNRCRISTCAWLSGREIGAGSGKATRVESAMVQSLGTKVEHW